ncbi:MAG: hypothetical protein ACI9W6_002452 [Motiliproteus sp.]|jgi:hypothetical protein
MSRRLINKPGQPLHWLLGLGALGLVGCAGQSSFSVPVEDRTPVGSRPMPALGASAPSAPSASAAPAPSAEAAISFPDPSRAPAPGGYAAPSASIPTPAAGYGGPSAVLLALMEQADDFESRGDRRGALAQLERAQRIAPRDPLVYLQLARLRLHMDDRVRAEQLARKGMSLSGADSDLRLAFEALLAELKPR